MEWVALGKNTEDIAVLMGLSRGGTDNRFRVIFEKLGANNRAHAVALVLKAEHQAALATLRAQYQEAVDA